MAIRSRSASALLFSVAAFVLLLASSSFAASDAPFIVAHKKVALTRLKSGAEQVSVTIDVYNQGTTAAYDVSLNDDSWSEDRFKLVSGTLTKTWERLDVGSLVSHSFVLESDVKGIFYGKPAVIKFRVPSKAALQEAYSTPILPLDILADKPVEKKIDLAKRILAKYGSLVSVISIVVLFVFVIVSPSKSSGAKASKKKR